MTCQIKLINKNKFAQIKLDKNNSFYVIYQQSSKNNNHLFSQKNWNMLVVFLKVIILAK